MSIPHTATTKSTIKHFFIWGGGYNAANFTGYYPHTTFKIQKVFARELHAEFLYPKYSFYWNNLKFASFFVDAENVGALCDKFALNLEQI